MIKNFLKQFFIYGLGKSGEKLLSFLLLPIYLKYINVEDYGKLEVIRVLSNFLGIVLIFGLNTGIFRHYYEYDIHKRKEVITSILFFLLISNIFILSGAVYFSSNISNLFFSTSIYMTLFIISFTTLFFNSIKGIYFSILRAEQKALSFSIINLIIVFIIIVFNIVFVVQFKYGIKGLLLGSLSGGVFSFIIFIIYIRNYITYKIRLSYIRELLIYSFPLALGLLPLLGIDLLDRFFLNWLVSAEELGNYSFAYKFGFVVKLVIVMPFSLAWAPYILSNYKSENIKRVISQILNLFLLFSMLIILIIILFSEIYIHQFFSVEYHKAINVIPLISAAYILYGLYMFFTIGILINKNTKVIPLITAIGLMINIICNFLLIPIYGIMGAAFSTFITFCYLFVHMFIVNQRVFKIIIDLKKVLPVFVIFLSILLVNKLPISLSVINDLILKLILIILYLIFVYYYLPETYKNQLKEILANNGKSIFFNNYKNKE